MVSNPPLFSLKLTEVPTNANMIQAESAGGGGGGGTGDYKDGGGSQVEEMKKCKYTERKCQWFRGHTYMNYLSTDCGKCKASPKKLNLNKFCMEDYGEFDIKQ